MKDRLVKVVCWRVVSIMITLLLLVILTGDIRSSSGITILLHFFTTVGHFAFETLWDRVFEKQK